jgi:hypothetical protein
MEFKFTYVGMADDGEHLVEAWDVAYTGGVARVWYRYHKEAEVRWRTGLNPPSEEDIAAALIDHVW